MHQRCEYLGSGIHLNRYTKSGISENGSRRSLKGNWMVVLIGLLASVRNQSSLMGRQGRDAISKNEQ